MARQIRYSYSPPGRLRKHYLSVDDIEVLLERLPEETYERLRAVHFNDRSGGRRWYGYVNRGHREIALCALPVRVSLSACFVRRSGRGGLRGSPRQFGAVRGAQWPETAVRRFLLYNGFLHELGHLQIVDPKARNVRRKFAGETMAQEFSDDWRARLWSEPFEHPDPIHNPPADVELELLEHELQQRSEPQVAS